MSSKKTSFTSLFSYLHNNVNAVNNSKLFAGLMIITLNIASKFVTIKLSRTMEAYLKYTFSRNVLIFAIVWMGSRDIYIALGITLVFMFLMDYILNESSSFCCLPQKFTDYHVSLLEEKITDEDIKRANEVLEKAKRQREEENKNTMQVRPPAQYDGFTGY